MAGTFIELMDTCAGCAIHYKGWREKLRLMADAGIEIVQTVLQVVRPAWPTVNPYKRVSGNEGDPHAVYDLRYWNAAYWDFLGEWVEAVRYYGMRSILALISHPTARKLGYLPAYNRNINGFNPDILKALSERPRGAWLEILQAYAEKVAPYLKAAGGCLPLLEGAGTRDFEVVFGSILMKATGSGVSFASSTIGNVPEVLYSPHVKSVQGARQQGDAAKYRRCASWIETDGWPYETPSSIVQSGRGCIGKPKVAVFGSWLGGALCGNHRIVNGRIERETIGDYGRRPLVTLADCQGEIAQLVKALGSLRRN